MERQVVLGESDANEIANVIRVMAEGKPTTTNGTVDRACGWADKLAPCSEGQWRPMGWFGDDRDWHG